MVFFFLDILYSTLTIFEKKKTIKENHKIINERFEIPQFSRIIALLIFIQHL